MEQWGYDGSSSNIEDEWDHDDGYDDVKNDDYDIDNDSDY